MQVAPPKEGPGARVGSPPQASVIYDSGCPACRGFSKLVDLLDIRGRLQLVPSEDPRALDLVPGETPEDLWKTFHLVTPRGEVLVRGEAFMEVLSALPGLSILARVIRSLPNHRVLANRLYAWLTRNRSWISPLVK